jgi:hypothetical protein
MNGIRFAFAATASLVLAMGTQSSSVQADTSPIDVPNSATTRATLILNFPGNPDPTETGRCDLLSGLICDSNAGTSLPLDPICSPLGGQVSLGYWTNGSQITFMPVLDGDADGDGLVDGADFTALRSHWGVASGGTWATGDFNYDGKVDGADFTVLRKNWSKTWYPVDTAVIRAVVLPEPSTFAVSVSLGLALIAVYGWRRGTKA